ncbi:MAG: hypothetical protein ACEPOV_10300 [Hyphomicrobiales bacterium]
MENIVITIHNCEKYNKMILERKIAEQIFEYFRETNCKDGDIVQMNQINIDLIPNLEPKEEDVFDTIFDGLISTEYFTYEEINIGKVIRLTRKGYNNKRALLSGLD